MPPERPQLPTVEQIFEDMPCGMLLTASNGTILKVNRTFCNWVGFPAEELVERKKLQELFTIGARIFHQTHWLPMLQMQGSLSEVKLDVQHQDGRVRPMLLNVIRRRSDVGTYDEIAVFSAEDRNKYEKELVQARKRADNLVLLEKDRSLFAEQMIGIVSHDLRNPLAVVMMAAKVLATKAGNLSDDLSQKLLANITRSSHRAQRLVEELLDFTAARVGAGVSVALQPMDLQETTARAVEELSLAHSPRLVVHRHIGESAVVADAHRLAQALGNLVSNAVAYGDAESAVNVTSRLVDDVASISVHNVGAPIPQDSISALFEPMVRGAPADSATRSVGLGLFIVRAIATAHRGSVSVTSTEEDGTVFVLSFPRGAVQEPGS